MAGQPYFNETSRWKQYLYYSSFPDNVYVEDALIQFDGDTLIENMIYFKVLKTGMETAYYQQQGDTTFHRSIHKFLDPVREEGLFIYAYNISEGKEYLLYDFSAEIGDTLQSGNCERDTVISIDTVYLGDKPKKRFHLPHAHAEIYTLVEGIGSTAGFFWEVCNTIPPFYLKLQCYSQDGDFIQFDPGPLEPLFDCSGLILANESIRENAFIISPNPFRDEIQIHLLGALPQTSSISILNLMGAVVFDKVIRSPEPIVRIVVPYLSAGIYVVLIRNKEGYSAKKMIKL